jgi:hypothetical protein
MASRARRKEGGDGMKSAWPFMLIASLLFAACGGGSDPSGSNGMSAEEFQDAAVGAVQDLQSYASTLNLGDGVTTEWEVERPDSYRTTIPRTNAETGDPAGTGEAVTIGETIYTRTCGAAGVCEPWQSDERGDVIAGALSPSYFPQWPLVAVELAEDVDFAEQPEGETLVPLRGSVSHVRAIYENAHREAEALGLSFNLEEALLNEDDTGYYDDHPGDVQWWVDPKTMLVSRVDVLVTPPEEDGPALLITATYSRFDDVTIEAPE